MTKEEKALLLKDLCARLPYGVFVKENRESFDDSPTIYTFYYHPYIDNCKPYLRPMSSMTDEEITEMNLIIYSARVTGEYFRITEYYNKNYLDYYDLIGHKLAIEAPEGMYDIK